jgi:rSAM/selenodomain-associated transferase 1
MGTRTDADAPRVAVVVMAKNPRSGQSKTRLQPAVAPDDAALLAAAMLGDRCAQIARRRDAVPAIALADPRDAELPAALVPEGFELIRCQGGGLGDDLLAAAEHFLGRGMPVVLVDSDSPTLPLAYLQSAVDALREPDEARRCDAVLGASEDGGYYLIGLRRSIPELFRDMPWSTAELTTATLARIAELGLTTRRLPDWWDVDRPEDLTRLRRALLRSSWPPRTAQWLRERESRGREPDRAVTTPAERWRAPWHQLSTRTVYANPWLSVREDIVRMPDGNHTLYGVIDAGQCVGVLPFVTEQAVLMVHQYRYVFGRVMLEMPTGGVDAGESHEHAAHRELAEEARVHADHLEYLGKYHTSSSVLDETAHLYLAHGLTDAGSQGADETEFIRVEEIPFASVLEMVLSGDILDPMTIVAVLRAARMRGV